MTKPESIEFGDLISVENAERAAKICGIYVVYYYESICTNSRYSDSILYIGESDGLINERIDSHVREWIEEEQFDENDLDYLYFNYAEFPKNLCKCVEKAMICRYAPELNHPFNNVDIVGFCTNHEIIRCLNLNWK